MLRRRTARRSLIGFTEYTLPIYKTAGHHRTIAEGLEAIEQGEIDRLLICMPPRHGKSELASRRFPAWFLGKHPTKSVIAASYNSDLANDFGRQVRNVAASREFGALFEMRLAEDSRAANRWNTAQGGAYYAAGVGTAVTGRGADCVAEGTLIVTEEFGEIPIERIAEIDGSVYVLSYDRHCNSAAFKKVQAFRRRSGAWIYRITTALGRMVETTGDHRVHTARGYVPTASLAAGDTLLCLLPDNVCERRFQFQQGVPPRVEGHVLLAGVQPSTSCNEEQKTLQALQSACPKENDGLLHPVPTYSAGAESRQANEAAVYLSAVQCLFRAIRLSARKVSSLLQQGLRESRSLASHVFQGQSEVEAWCNAGPHSAALRQGVSRHEAADLKTRRPQVREVQRRGYPVGSPSFGQQPNEQRGEQLGNAVLPLSSEVARGVRQQTASDTVARVERVRFAPAVYDIQVEGTNCFFANGILVHNCLLIDDPFKDREEADSEIRRERVWDWYRSTAYTRLHPGGRIVVIATRWHEDDLVGRLLDEAAKGGDQWVTLILPAISEQGAALWPESYPVEVLERHRRAIGPREWSALYQQRPAPDEGVYFKREWFRWYVEKPKHLRIYGASDYAVTEGGGDYTVHVVVGIDPDDNLHILDVWRGQTESHVWVETFLDLVKQYQPLTWAEEDGQILKSIGPFIDRRSRERCIYCHREQFVTVRDKPTRCRSFQARTSMGKVYLPKDAPWLDALLSELLTFPAGRHDDQVDALGTLGRLLDTMVEAHVPTIQQPNYLDEYRPVTSRDDSGENWKTV